jgi:hypothetical protein
MENHQQILKNIRKFMHTAFLSIFLLTALWAVSGCKSKADPEVQSTETYTDTEVVYFKDTDLYTHIDSEKYKGSCKIDIPVKATGLSHRLALKPSATISLEMFERLQKWQSEVVQPLAAEHFGLDVSQLKVSASYSCRRVNNGSGSRKMSQHSYGKALDISAFTLSDGTTMTVLKDFRNEHSKGKFLRAVNKVSCKFFSTVIGPNGDSYHQDHFHLDIKTRRNKEFVYCH